MWKKEAGEVPVPQPDNDVRGAADPKGVDQVSRNQFPQSEQRYPDPDSEKNDQISSELYLSPEFLPESAWIERVEVLIVHRRVFQTLSVLLPLLQSRVDPAPQYIRLITCRAP